MESLLKQLNLHAYIGAAERAAVDLATLSSSSKQDIVDLGFPIGVATAIYKHLNASSSEVRGLPMIRRAQLALHEKLGEGFFGSVRPCW